MARFAFIISLCFISTLAQAQSNIWGARPAGETLIPSASEKAINDIHQQITSTRSSLLSAQKDLYTAKTTNKDQKIQDALQAKVDALQDKLEGLRDDMKDAQEDQKAARGKSSLFLDKYSKCIAAIQDRDSKMGMPSSILIGDSYIVRSTSSGPVVYSDKASTTVTPNQRECTYGKESASSGILKALDPEICLNCMNKNQSADFKKAQSNAQKVCSDADEDVRSHFAPAAATGNGPAKDEYGKH